MIPDSWFRDTPHRWAEASPQGHRDVPPAVRRIGWYYLNANYTIEEPESRFHGTCSILKPDDTRIGSGIFIERICGGIDSGGWYGS